MPLSGEARQQVRCLFVREYSSVSAVEYRLFSCRYTRCCSIGPLCRVRLNMRGMAQSYNVRKPELLLAQPAANTQTNKQTNCVLRVGCLRCDCVSRELRCQSSALASVLRQFSLSLGRFRLPARSCSSMCGCATQRCCSRASRLSDSWSCSPVGCCVKSASTALGIAAQPRPLQCPWPVQLLLETAEAAANFHWRSLPGPSPIRCRGTGTIIAMAWPTAAVQ